MKHRSLKALTAIAAAAVLAPSAMAQLDPAYDRSEPLYLSVIGVGEVILQEGQKVTYNNAEYIVKGGQLSPTQPGEGPVPINSTVTTKGMTGTLHKHMLSFGYYPLVVFSTGGSLINSKNALVPGTYTDNGSVFALNGTIGLSGHQQFELGGFFFQPYGVGDNLYQIDAKYMLTPNFGLQVAYINSANVNAESTSYFLIMRSQGSLGNPRRNDLGLEVGLGLVNDFTSTYNYSTSTSIDENTLNFSAFVTLSYNLGKNVKLLASDWYIRDRNDDVTRFGLGVSISF